MGWSVEEAMASLRSRRALGLAVLALLAFSLGLSNCPSPPPRYGHTTNPVHIAENEIRSIVEQVQLYRETRQRLPDSLLELIRTNLLRNAQEDGRVLDPWKRPYEYRLDESAHDAFIVLSRGADPNDPEDDLRSDRRPKR